MIGNLDILSILTDKESYTRFSPFIKEHLVGKESWVIIGDLGEWYEKHEQVDWEKFAPWFFIVRHPMYNREKVAVFDTVFDKLKEHEIEEALKEQLVEHFIAKDYAMKIAETGLAITEGSASYKMGDISELYSEYETELDLAADLETFLVTDEAILEEDDPSKAGLTWRLEELNEAVGPIKKGNFLMVGAYVGAGKTAMLVSEATHMAPQLKEDEYILWFNNEEDGGAVRKRIQSAVTGFTKEMKLRDPDKFQEAWNDSDVRGKIKIIDKGAMFTNDMEAYMKKYTPGLIIIDQLWKVHGFTRTTDNEVTRVSLMFNWGREIAKKYCPVITVHQADGSAHGQEWIEVNQLYNSKVAVQGEMDVIMTLGRSLDAGMEDVRGLYTPKNKLTGKEDYKAHVILNKDLSLFESPSSGGTTV